MCNLTARNESTHFLRSELISYIEKHWAHLRTGKPAKQWAQSLCSTMKGKVKGRVDYSHFFHMEALNGLTSTTFALTGVGIPDGSVAVPKSVFEGIKSRLSYKVRETKAVLSDLVNTPPPASSSLAAEGISSTIDNLRSNLKVREKVR